MGIKFILIHEQMRKLIIIEVDAITQQEDLLVEQVLRTTVHSIQHLVQCLLDGQIVTNRLLILFLFGEVCLIEQILLIEVLLDVCHDLRDLAGAHQLLLQEDLHV